MAKKRSNDEGLGSRISRIQTRWTLLMNSRESNTNIAAAARAQLAMRYSGATYRYLLSLVRNAEEAEDLTQVVALKFLEGKFSGADRLKGRFRDYLKSAVINVARDYLNSKGRLKEVSIDSLVEIVERSASDSWVECLHEAYLERALAQLEEDDAHSGKQYASLLYWRTEHGDASSQEMALFLSGQTGEQTSAVNARKTLQRARDRFVELVVDEVRQSLPENARAEDDVDEQLAAIRLLELCRPARNRQKQK